MGPAPYYSRKYEQRSFESIEELYRKQRAGKFLTHEEKERIKKYAEQQRKKNNRKK